MSEEIKRIYPYEKKMKCDKCKKGYMVFTGNAFRAGVSHNEHKCDNCKCIEAFINKRYPIIFYKEK